MSGTSEIDVIAGLDEFLKITYLFLSKPEAGLCSDLMTQSLTPIQFLDPFRDVVDWEALELLDYPEIVKNPMDLGTLKVFSLSLILLLLIT
jgi:hypothetical protein